MTRPLHSFIALARSDPEAAVLRARADGHAGNRCHYLAWAAHFAGERRVAAIAREALATCGELENSYDGVALAAWPLRALAERGLAEECERALPRVFERARGLDNPVCRLDGLERVFQAVFPVAGARRLVLAELIAACRAASSWKAPRCLARAAAMLAAAAPDEVALALAALPDGAHRRRALRDIAAGGLPLRTFFW